MQETLIKAGIAVALGLLVAWLLLDRRADDWEVKAKAWRRFAAAWIPLAIVTVLVVDALSGSR